MTAQRVHEIAVGHGDLSRRYRLGSIPAGNRSPEEVHEEILAGPCYEVRPDRDDAVSYISFVSMARTMSGVWLAETLAPEDADAAFWAAALNACVQEHIETHLTSRIVQRFSVSQRERSDATRELGWRFEGVLKGYYRLDGEQVDAEQWSLMGERRK